MASPTVLGVPPPARAVLLMAMVLCMGTEVAPREGVPPPANCSRSCGEIDVPYPFGLDDGSEDCCRSDDFSLTCNSTHYHPPKLFFDPDQTLPVERILPSLAQARFLMAISYDCYNRTTSNAGFQTWWMDISDYTFALSYRENVFVAVGCDLDARFEVGAGTDNFGGCMSGCSSEDLVEDGDCSGIGCCQSSIPKHIRQYQMDFTYRSNQRKTYRFNNCSYAFMVEKSNYTFRRSDLAYMNHSTLFPIIVDWYIGNQSCEEAKKNRTGYACVSSNSRCLNSSNGPGYVCNCSQGYQGNPYVEGGCTDIDECKSDPRLYPCMNGTCVNTDGGYSCTCPDGFTSRDAKLEACLPLPKVFAQNRIPPAAIAVIGSTGGLLLLTVGVLLFCVGYHRRKNQLLRKHFFERNGGIFLERALSADRNSTASFKIFTKDELDRATRSFDRDLVVGQGAFGEVYKGFLDDGTAIAVKRSMSLDEKNGREFANEILILSKVNHRNVVKLLGCCLESKVPMLAYEYVPGGTLFHFLHGSGGARRRIRFSTRVRIASEAAAALRYLHADALPPICHGDVKTSNILLDEGLVAKISDFGTSTLACKDKSQFKTLVQGTYGYLDPEYLLTGELTLASDVFSFGVVLAELLTRRLPFKSEQHGSGQALANHFLSCAKGNKLEEILDAEIASEGREVMEVAEMAVRCLSMRGEERPSMKEVEAVLEGLSARRSHPWEESYYRREDAASALLEGADDATVESRAIFRVERAR